MAKTYSLPVTADDLVAIIGGLRMMIDSDASHGFIVAQDQRLLERVRTLMEEIARG